MSSTVTRVRGPPAASDPERHVAGAAGHVEMGEGAVLRRPQHRDELRLPGPVQARRHQVVHDVVAAGDRVEDAVDAPLLLVERHALEAEIRARALRRPVSGLHDAPVPRWARHSEGRARPPCVETRGRARRRPRPHPAVAEPRVAETGS